MGEIPKYMGHHRQGLEGVSRDPRFDPKYGEGFGITLNLLRGYGILLLCKRQMPQNLDMRCRTGEENGTRDPSLALIGLRTAVFYLSLS